MITSIVMFIIINLVIILHNINLIFITIVVFYIVDIVVFMYYFIILFIQKIRSHNIQKY